MDSFADILKEIQILGFTLTGADIVKNIKHLFCPKPTGHALAA
jgi:hypothetical protein